LSETGGDKVANDFLVIGIRLEEVIVGVDAVTFALDGGKELGEGGVVFVGNEMGFGDHGGVVFEVDEAVGTLEVECHFLGIEKVEDRDIVFAEAKVLKGLAEFLRIGKEIGKDDDEGALLNLLGDLVKGSDESSATFRFKFVEGIEDGLELGRATAGRDLEVDLFVAARKAGGVTLIDNEIGERGGDALRELDLGWVVAGREIHRARGIDDKVSAQVGVGFELLDVVAIGAGVGLPIEPAGVVARDVFTIFREFYGGTTMWRTVATGDVAHHGKARLHRNGAKTGKDVGVEEVVFHENYGVLLRGTTSLIREKKREFSD